MIQIFTFGSHRADFIDLQMRSFKKFLQEEFKFTVFNNAQYDSTGGAQYHQLHEQGRQLGISVIDIQKDQDLIYRCQAIEPSCSLFNPAGQYSNANVAHAYAFRWAWENVILKEKGAIAIFDSDVFLIESLKLTDILHPHQLVCIQDGKPHPDGRAFHYMWPTFILADMARLPDPETLNFWCGRIEGIPVDVGGQTHWYFEAHPDLDVYYVRRLHSYYLEPKGLDFDPPDFDEFYPADKTILHYRSGSNWNARQPEYHIKKTEWLKKRIEKGQ